MINLFKRIKAYDRPWRLYRYDREKDEDVIIEENLGRDECLAKKKELNLSLKDKERFCHYCEFHGE